MLKNVTAYTAYGATVALLLATVAFGTVVASQPVSAEEKKPVTQTVATSRVKTSDKQQAAVLAFIKG